MPFLVAEILNFQGSAHHVGVGSLSNIEKYPYLENYMNILGSSTDMKILIETVLKILHEIQSIY